MPYFTRGVIGPNPDAASLEDFPVSAMDAASASAGNVWDSNPTVMAVQYLRTKAANQGVKLDQASAQKQVADAGVKLDVPQEGYSQAALDILISRQQDNARRSEVLSRAPTGFAPATMELTASLAAGIADPIGLGAMLVPGLGEARVASLMARAGESAIARGAVRAGVGAVQGGIGMAALEPASYALHQGLGDDYTMRNSLENIAFGSVMGGTIHALGGVAADFMRAGPHPAIRFVGMGTEDINRVMRFERERATMTPEDQARALSSFSPAERKAIGVGDVTAPVTELGDNFRTEAPPESAVATSQRIDPAIHETAMRQAITDLATGKFPDVERIVRLDPKAIVPDANTPLIPEPNQPTVSTLEQVRATAERQAKPESVAIADFFSAMQAEHRLANAPRGEVAQAADEALAQANERLQAVLKNMIQGGISEDALAAKTESLKAYDERLSDADSFGNAVKAAAMCGARQ